MTALLASGGRKPPVAPYKHRGADQAGVLLASCRLRAGYTLFELVLVMAVIVALAGLTVPLIEPMLAPNRIQAASDLVRTEWAEMRARAMSEGRAYRFSVQENTGKYKIEPEEPPGQDDNEPVLQVQGELPEQVVFVKSEMALVGANAAPQGSGQWDTVAVFLPEGNARDDALLYFGLPGMRASGVRLRALTGAVSVVEFKEVQP